MLQGLYEIWLQGKKDERLKISSDIVIQDNQCQLTISKDGKVQILADTEERLSDLRLIAQIAVRRASAWMPFELSRVSEIDLATRKELQRPFYGQVSTSTFSIDSIQCQNTARNLLSTSYESLLFLTRSTDFLDRYAEVSALIALTGLEVELGEVVTADGLEVGQKIEVLRYLNVLSSATIGKIKNLFRLRNKLAHGDWESEAFRNALASALGGQPARWVISSVGRMTHEAAREVVQEVMKSLSVLSPLKQKLPPQSAKA